MDKADVAGSTPWPRSQAGCRSGRSSAGAGAAVRLAPTNYWSIVEIQTEILLRIRTVPRLCEGPPGCRSGRLHRARKVVDSCEPGSCAHVSQQDRRGASFISSLHWRGESVRTEVLEVHYSGGL